MSSCTKKTILLDRGRNTSCSIHIHGATLLSWRVNNVEQIFVSAQTAYSDKEGIRGGIPVVFPYYGLWNVGPKNGFARILKWRVEEPPKRLENRDVSVTFSLRDSEYTRAMWNYKFCLLYTVTLSETSIHLNIDVQNTSPDTEIEFDLLLHTYFKVPDIRACRIDGLKGCSFRDIAEGGISHRENRQSVTVSEYTERVYRYTASEHCINDLKGGKTIKVVKSGMPDTVIWNPWEERIKLLKNINPDQFPNMICVGSGHISTPVLLPPGQVFSSGLSYHVLRRKVLP